MTSTPSPFLSQKFQAEAPLTYKNSPLCVVRFGLEMVLSMHEAFARISSIAIAYISKHNLTFQKGRDSKRSFLYEIDKGAEDQQVVSRQKGASQVGCSCCESPKPLSFCVFASPAVASECIAVSALAALSEQRCKGSGPIWGGKTFGRYKGGAMNTQLRRDFLNCFGCVLTVRDSGRELQDNRRLI